jgi:hypothetical protein
METSMSQVRNLIKLSCCGLIMAGLELAGCQSTGDEQALANKADSSPTQGDPAISKPVRKAVTPPARDASGHSETTPAPAAAEEAPATPAPAPPPPPEQPAISNQQIDRYLAEGQVTYERAAKLRYREATRMGQVKTKADHAYWSTVIEIYRNWDNRYISWDEVQKRLSAAEAAHQ